MKKKIAVLVFCFSITLYNCKNEKQSSDKTTQTEAENSLKDISELTYFEVYTVLFADKNGGFDAHGDLYGQDAVTNLMITEENSECGKTLFLASNSDKEITLAIKASFSFPGNPVNEIVRAYTLKPTEKISTGNSKLCYNGKEYDIKRDIISAGFSTLTNH